MSNINRYSNFPNGFSQGVTIRGMPILNTYAGNVWWVDSGAGSDGNDGTVTRPFATLDYAVGKCTANNGDLIVLKPGHSESVIADSGVDIDVAGVSVVGLGTGADRPTFTFTTAVTADFKLAANNVTVENILFKAGIDALTGPIEVSADDCAIINCEYQDDDTNNYETVDVIVTASTPLRMLIDGFKFVHDGGSGGTQNQSVIQLNGADKAVIRNCWIVADSGTGVIEDATVSDQILIEKCVVENTNTSPVVAILLQATTTGTIQHTMLRVASGTTYLTATNDMSLFESFGTGTDATTGEKVGTILSGDIEGKIDTIDGYFDVPTADVTTNTTMRDVVGNKTDAAAAGDVSGTETLMAYVKQAVSELSGSAGIPTFPAGAAPANAVSIAEVIRAIYNAVSADGSAGATTVQPGIGRRVTKVTDMTADPDDLFTVTGKCLVTLMVGEVTSVIATTTSISLNTSTNSQVIAASTQITTDAAGTLYIVSGDPDDTLNGGTTPGVDAALLTTGVHCPFLINDDAIYQNADAGGTGTIQWDLYYIPLEDSASIASSA